MKTAFYKQSTQDIAEALDGCEIIQAWVTTDIDKMLDRSNARERHHPDSCSRWMALYRQSRPPNTRVAVWAWLMYFYTHLGVSFVLSAAITTPGCEMRSIPELYGRLTGKESAEHVCPASFITRLDEWERTKLSHA